MTKKTVVLFDMDGTLTPARKPAPDFLIPSLNKLSSFGLVGILTGSDMNYLIQQCKNLWEGENSCDPSKFVLLPCNGTKFYTWNGNDWSLEKSSNMRKELGDSTFDLLMKILIGAQFTHISSEPDHPLTGHFIQYRESMINWCQVGRNANDEQRKKFIEYDNQTDMRYRLMIGVQTMVDKAIGQDKIKFALGGNTSVDIYPVGWDKTYGLSHFPNSECWFVGDRCEENGNDKTIYDALSTSGRAYKTSGPENTAEIIDEIISRLKNQ